MTLVRAALAFKQCRRKTGMLPEACHFQMSVPLIWNSKVLIASIDLYQLISARLRRVFRSLKWAKSWVLL